MRNKEVINGCLDNISLESNCTIKISNNSLEIVIKTSVYKPSGKDRSLHSHLPLTTLLMFPI